MTASAVLLAFLIAAASQASLQAETPAAAPVYVTMVSHFDRPFAITKADLEALAQLSANHPKMRWTHLFNPVAYTQETPLRHEMEQFVLQSRDQHAAEIGVHLHMYKSLLEKAGVPFRSQPSVNARMAAGSADESGYSVPMSAYAREELRTLLEFTLKTFDRRGLGRPATFCAGYYATSLDLQKEIAAQGFVCSAAAFPPGTEIGKAYPPSWRELSGWDETVRFDTAPYRISQTTILPAGEPPYIQASDGKPLVEIPQTCKIDWMVSSDDIKVIFKKHLSIAGQGRPTAICLAMHDMYAKDEFAKYDEVLRYIDECVAESDHRVPVRYATISQVRAALLEHWISR
jgi:hypothetical protein